MAFGVSFIFLKTISFNFGDALIAISCMSLGSISQRSGKLLKRISSKPVLSILYSSTESSSFSVSDEQFSLSNVFKSPSPNLIELIGVSPS